MNALTDWVTSPLKDVAPAASKTIPDANTEVWNLSLDEIESKTGRILRRTRCQVSDLGSSKCCFDESHVLYSKLRPYLNKVVLPDGFGVGTSELVPMKPDPVRLNREYLAFYLRSPSFVDYANANTRGANLPRISMAKLWSHEIAFPQSLKAQSEIVDRIKKCLKIVGEAERLRESQLIELQAVPDAVLDSLVDDSWPVSTIADVINDSRNGWSGKQQKDKPELGMLRLSCVHSKTIDDTDVKPVRVDSKTSLSFLLRKGDVFVVRGNGSPHLVGRSAHCCSDNDRAIFNDLLIRLRFKDVVLPQFANFVLHTRRVREQIRDAARTAAGIWKINQTGLKELRIPVPSLSCQKAFVENARSALLSCVKIESSFSASPVDKARDAILFQAFNGEL